MLTKKSFLWCTLLFMVGVQAFGHSICLGPAPQVTSALDVALTDFYSYFSEDTVEKMAQLKSCNAVDFPAFHSFFHLELLKSLPIQSNQEVFFQSIGEFEDLFLNTALRASESYGYCHCNKKMGSILSTDCSRADLKASMLSTVRQLLQSYLSRLFLKDQTFQNELLEKIKNRIDAEYLKLSRNYLFLRSYIDPSEMKVASSSMGSDDRIRFEDQANLWSQFYEADQEAVDLGLYRDQNELALIVPRCFKSRLLEFLFANGSEIQEISVSHLVKIFVDMMKWAIEDRTRDIAVGPLKFSKPSLPGLSELPPLPPYLAIRLSQFHRKKNREKVISLIQGLLPFYLSKLGVDDAKKRQILDQIEREMNECCHTPDGYNFREVSQVNPCSSPAKELI